VLPSPARVQQRFHPSQYPPEWFREYAHGVGWDTSSGVNVTPETAMRVTGALACIRIIADTEASLPFFTFRRIARGKEKATDHYLYSILHDIANPEMSAFTFRRTITAHVASRGNGISEIEFDGGGRVKALWPLNPDKVKLERDPRSRKLFYFYTLPESEGGYTVRLPAERILHIKWLSQNGLWAMSPVQIQRESLGISIAAQEFMARFFSNDASPRGALETPNALSDKAWDRLKNDWEDRHGGLENKHRYAILEEGLKFNPISLSPQDIMLMDLMHFGVEDVGRIWGISSDMLNLADKAATYASVEQFGIRFTQHTVRPWVVNWEQECHRSLLTESERKEYFTEHNLDGLLRGDYATRTAGYSNGITNGWLMRNEAREFENLNPKEGLDEPLVPLNMGNASAPQEPPTAQRDVMMPIYQDIFQRIERREKHDLESASKKIKDDAKLQGWISEFYENDHHAFVRMQIAPALKSHAALRGYWLNDADLLALSDREARKYCNDAFAQMPELYTHWIERLSNGVKGISGLFGEE
jgi:HK97 family phage portal protein